MSLMTGTHGAAADADPITVIEAPGDAPRPAVLILHGRDGVRPAEVYRRYVDELAAAGVDAGLFSYYSPADAEVMLNPREAHVARYIRVEAPAEIVGGAVG